MKLSSPHQHHYRRSVAGFSLVEMAIVLVIFALLAGGMMLTLGAQQDIQKTSEVRRQLTDIREAILGYAVANGRLPPPAPPTKANTDPTAGVIEEGRTTGVIPWITLGLPETDPWGQRFTYRVTVEFADNIGVAPLLSCPPAPPPSLASFALCSSGNITITDGSNNIATGIPAVIVSHGKNGFGGYRPDGSQAASGSAEELENANGDTKFISHSQSANFDDEVIWIPLYNLMSRMITAGRLP